MRLDWNDIKARAATFAGDWKDSHYERGETQTFYNEFFELFQERLPLPDFDCAMREKLLYACGFNWEKISPAIFGSLFQSVMDKFARRKQGAHYTSERNILKVIEPLFLDDLKGEFARLKARKDTGRRRALEDFHAKLGGLTFFDPACGCGNFLVIAYRDLRELEIAVRSL